jgi:hypothetical protein
MNPLKILPAWICCFCIGGTLYAQDSPFHNAEGKGCRPLTDTTHENMLLNGIDHQYYLHSKSYIFTDTAKQHQYKGIVVLKSYRQATLSDKKAIARQIVNKYSLNTVLLVSSCSILDMMWSSLTVDKEAINRRKKTLKENSIQFTTNEL